MKRLFFIITCCFVASVVMQAQPVTNSTPEAMLKSAEEAAANNNPYAALELYEKLYKENKDKSVANKIANMNYELRDYGKAETYYSRLVLRDRKKENTEYKYWYAKSMMYNGKYDEAIPVFEEYVLEGKDELRVKEAKMQIEGCRMAKKAKQDEKLLINNAGKKLNSPQTEASPSGEDQTVYYASMNGKEVVTVDGGKEGDYYTKIYSATKAGTEFGAGTALNGNINREGYHQGNVSLSADGKVMYFTRVQLDNNGMSESKIFYSLRNGGEWGAANEVQGVNGDFIAKHPRMGELFGEKVMFFTSNMPGGKGGYDIYYAPRKEDGVFGLPVNLGEGINTPGNEECPFYRDGILYFSTDGYVGFGGMDIYKSTWNGTAWGAPTNMGVGYNSSVDDLYFSMDKDGYTGYFVSNRPSENSIKSPTCCDDIYTWEIERVRVNLDATTFRFKKSKEKENQPLPGCTVMVLDVTEKNPAKIDTKTNAAGNDYVFALQPEKEYMVIASAPGFLNDTVKVNTVGLTRSKNIEKKLTLRTEKIVTPPAEPDSMVVSTNQPIRLGNIYYDYDDDKILPAAEQDLNFILGLLNQYPDMQIELSSHTDSRGNDAYNEKLSQRRANSAMNWLFAKGVAQDRIVAKGYGEAQILNGCTNGVKCDDEQHRFNRRTEFRIISGPTSITIEKKVLKEKTGNNGGKQSTHNPLLELIIEGYFAQDTTPPGIFSGSDTTKDYGIIEPVSKPEKKKR